MASPRHDEPLASAADMDAPSMVELGKLLNGLRLEKGVTISSLAAEAGVSSGLVSQIERGVGNPSYTTLIKLAQALGVPVGSFFAGMDDTDQSVRVVRRSERRRLLLSERDLVYELLTPTMSGRLGMVQAQVPAGWSNEDAPYRHEGDECITMLRGQLIITVNGTEHLLAEGDSLTYDASAWHWYRNETAKEALLLGAMSPPTF